MTMAAVVVLEPQPNLRAELAEGILAVWHKGRQYYLKLGRLLIEARQKLSAGEFNAMLEEDMPFGYDNARRFMRIASDPRVATLQKAPDSFAALDELRKLSDVQFEAAIATGQIHDDLTVKEAQRVVRDYIHIDAKPPALHRPQAVARHAAPALPEGRGATTLSELIFLFISRRHALGLSQAAVDDKVGWAEGLCSKYEILHRDDGRTPSIEAILEYAQAMKCGLALIPL